MSFQIGRFPRLLVRVPKGVFNVRDDRVFIATLVFPGMSNVAWLQSVNGEVFHETPAGSLGVQDFSNEIYSLQNTGAMDISFWFYPGRQDTLYHMDSNGHFLPRFTARFTPDDLQPHSYVELPDYFLGNTSALVYTVTTDGSNTDRSIGGKQPAYYIVDKKSLKGAFLRVDNDLLGKK